MPGAEVIRLTDLVTYQDGAVVSRTLVKAATGTVTLFAFDEAQGLSEHTTPHNALAQILEGEAEDSPYPANGHANHRPARRFFCPPTSPTR